MNIYFDTEFTGLVPNTTLISIGMVTDRGEKYYAEFTDYNENLVTGWIREHVIDNLKHGGTTDIRCKYLSSELGYDEALGPTYMIRDDLRNWLHDVSAVYESTSDVDGTVYTEPTGRRQIQLIADVCHYDMYLLCNQIFGGAFNLPGNVNPVCYDICQDINLGMYCAEHILEHRMVNVEEQDGVVSVDSSIEIPTQATTRNMRRAFDQSREELCKQLNYGRLPEGQKHNALYDAEVIKMIYEGMRRND